VEEGTVADLEYATWQAIVLGKDTWHLELYTCLQLVALHATATLVALVSSRTKKFVS
jgi:hypothetical protein